MERRARTNRRLVVAGGLVAATTSTLAQAPAPVTPESLVTAAKRAAGQDHANCVEAQRLSMN